MKIKKNRGKSSLRLQAIQSSELKSQPSTDLNLFLRSLAAADEQVRAPKQALEIYEQIPRNNSKIDY